MNKARKNRTRFIDKVKRLFQRNRRPVIRLKSKSGRPTRKVSPVAVPVRSKPWLALLLVAALLAACSPQTSEIPETGAEGTAVGDSEIGGTNELLGALRAQGATVESSGTVQQEFFPVDANLLKVNGQDVQVFEFADENTRASTQATISADASTIGTSIPTWVASPHFWAKGRLIVLYVGEDQATVDLLTGVLGTPIAERSAAVPAGTTAVQPEAVVAAIQQLAASAGVDISQVSVVRFEATEWTDSCLGLGQANESCAQVVTPGFLVVLEVNGQQFEFHTDQAGTNIRQK
jgi:hypothetical protein